MEAQRGEETCLGSHSIDTGLRLDIETAAKARAPFLTTSLGIPAKDALCHHRVTLHTALVLRVPIRSGRWDMVSPRPPWSWEQSPGWPECRDEGPRHLQGHGGPVLPPSALESPGPQRGGPLSSAVESYPAEQALETQSMPVPTHPINPSSLGEEERERMPRGYNCDINNVRC